MLREKVRRSTLFCDSWSQFLFFSIGRYFHDFTGWRGTRLIWITWGALPAYAEYQLRRGSGEACFASYRFVPQSKFCCAVLARLQRLTTHARPCDRRKPEAHVRQRRVPFGAKETQPMVFAFEFSWLGTFKC